MTSSPDANENTPQSWGNPAHTGSAFDFRSDVVTTPSRSILAAIANATLNDDVYDEDKSTAAFERHMAQLCGHEAAAFVITGTMANQLALRSLLEQPPYAILTDARSHLIHFEAGGVALLNGAMVQAVRPLNGQYLTVHDAAKHAIVTDDVHKAPTRVISIENTCGGAVMPLLELQRLKTWAAEHGIAVHMDGARLWEAVSASETPVRAFAQCCDVLTLDFSKNLGAPMGAMVVGSADLVRRLKRIRKAIGGGMRQAGVLAAAARRAVLDNFGHGQLDEREALGRSRRLAAAVAAMWTERGGRLLRKPETNMLWLDLKHAGVDAKTFNETGERHGIKLGGKRVVLHHQICDAAMVRIDAVISDLIGAKASSLGVETQTASLSRL